MTLRLTELALPSFRCYRGITFDLDAPRIYIGGRNATGKSSLREALKWLLYGRCQGLSENGAGTDLLAPQGTTSAEVRGQLAGIGLATRVWSPTESGLRVEGCTGASSLQQGALLAKLRVPEAWLRAVLDSSAFLALHHAEAKALVLGLLDVRVTTAPDLESDPLPMTLEELDDAYKRAFDARKAEKQRLKFMGPLPVAPAWMTPPGFKVSAEPPDAGSIAQQLITLHDKIGAKQQELGTTAADRRHVEDEIAGLDRRLAQPEPLDRTATLADLRAQIEALEAALAVPVGQAPGAAREGSEPVALLRSRGEALERHVPKDGCVLDPTVPCKTAVSAFRQRGAELLGAEVDPAPPPIRRNLAEELKDARRVLASTEQLQGARDRWLDERQGAERRRAELVGALGAIPDTSTLEAEIQALRERVANGERLQKAIASYLAAVSAAKKAATDRKDTETRIERLEALCEALGPKGARVPALQEAIGRFEAAIAPTVSPFGYTVKFSVDPWGVVVNDRPVETYSRSEQYRIGIGIQLAVAQLSGLSFAVVDELDVLDAANRRILSGWLYQTPVEQVVILGTREDDAPLPKAPHTKVYRLGRQDGWTVITERG